MVTYSKSLNLYPIFTGITLILAIFIGISLFNSNYPQTARACFFVGNGAYYALSAQEAVTTPPVYDSFKNSDEFLNNFQPDSIVCDVARAFYEKEPNIFMTYKTWASFVRLKERITNIFAAVGVTAPLEQIYIKDGGPLLHLADARVIKDHTDIERHCKKLHPNLGNFFHYLYLFNSAEWRMYDTKVGLFYLTPESTTSMPIQISDFKEIDPVFAQTKEFITQELFTKDYEWTNQLDHVFTPSSTAWQLYVTGHGNDPILDGTDFVEEKLFDTGSNKFYMYAWMAGMRSNKFVPFLQFIDTKLKTETLFMNSCYASADRIRKLLGTNGAPSFNIISPISTTFNSVTNYVFPLHTTTYVPACLTPQKTAVIENQVEDNNDPNQEPFGVKKYENLLNLVDKPKELAQHINLFFREKPEETPSLIPAFSTKVKKLIA